MQEQTLQALEHLRAMVKPNFYLRRRRILADSSHSKKRRSTIEREVQELGALVTEITRDNYAHVIVPRLESALKRDLCEAMRQAFAAYGPSSDFSAIAMTYAIAHILIHCGIEESDPVATVAERLRKRAERAQKPAKD